jgi:hypothetical protein
VLWLLLVHIVMTGLTIAGMALVCVGLLLVFPFVQLAWTAGYLLIAGTRRPVQK